MSDDVVVKVKLDNSNFKKNINDTKNQMNNFSEAINSSMKKVGKAIAAGLAIEKIVEFGKSIVSAGVSYNALKEQSQTTWTTLLGSQDKAIEQLAKIEEYATKTPFSQMGVDTMAKYLHNAAYEGDAVFETLTKIGDMGSAFGIQEDSLVEMTRQFAQVQQAGYAYTEDLNILADRGVPIYKAIAETVGVTVAEVKKMASEGKITADIYNAAIDSMAETTAGAMDAQSQTFNGIKETFEDTVSKLVGLLTADLFDSLKELAEKVLKVVETFTRAYQETGNFKNALIETLNEFGLEEWANLITSIEDTINRVKDLTLEFLTNKDAMVLLGIALGTVTTALIAYNASSILASISLGIQNGLLAITTTATTLATTATLLFGAAIQFLASPITITVVAIGALIAIIYLLITNWDAVKEAGIKCWEAIKEAWDKVSAWFAENVVKPLKEDWDKFWADLSQWGEDTKQKIQDSWDSVCKWFEDTVTDPLMDSWDNFWNSVDSWALETKENIQNDWNRIVGWFDNNIINPVEHAFKELWNGIERFLENPLEGIKSMFKSCFNWIADKMNTVIDGLNKVQVPDWVPLVGGKGINIPRIPKLWKGTNFAQGGVTLVGEQGPELVTLNRGASVLPAHKTRSVLDGKTVSSHNYGSEKSVNIFVEMDGRTVVKAIGQPLMDTIRMKTGLAL